MNPPPATLGPVDLVTRAPMVAIPLQSRIEPSTPRLAMDTFQFRAHGVLGYLVETLRRTW